MSSWTSPADRQAALRQLRLPGEAEVAAVDGRGELEAGYLAEGGLSGCGVLAGGGDRADDALHRQLALDLYAAVVGEADLGRAGR